MIGTEFLPGQGLGNRLFCYITARCLAEDLGVPFVTAGWEFLQADFLSAGPGLRAEELPPGVRPVRYDEAEERIYCRSSPHDMTRGCYIAGTDPALRETADRADVCTLLYGNLQDEAYFRGHREDIRRWLAVKPEYESDEYTADDLCILNLRGGEYRDKSELFLRKKYWTDAMALMRRENPDMRFMIVTDDVEAARELLPELPAYHFSPEKDYVTVKNARYLIISNSSFAFFPAYTSDTVRRVIAPKYWARHNVSDGYWASEQNIYDEFLYLDRDGRLYTAEQCREELAAYRRSRRFARRKRQKAWEPDASAVRLLRQKQALCRKLRRAADKLRRCAAGAGPGSGRTSV